LIKDARKKESIRSCKWLTKKIWGNHKLWPARGFHDRVWGEETIARKKGVIT